MTEHQANHPLSGSAGSSFGTVACLCSVATGPASVTSTAIGRGGSCPRLERGSCNSALARSAALRSKSAGSAGEGPGVESWCPNTPRRPAKRPRKPPPPLVCVAEAMPATDGELCDLCGGRPLCADAGAGWRFTVVESASSSSPCGFGCVPADGTVDTAAGAAAWFGCRTTVVMLEVGAVGCCGAVVMACAASEVAIVCLRWISDRSCCCDAVHAHCACLFAK